MPYTPQRNERQIACLYCNSLCKANYVLFHILAVNKQTKSDYFEITMQKI